MISNTAHNRVKNIKGSPYRVNAIGALALILYTLLKCWLVYGVELGKDEAVYWYWSQHLDASYALLPFSLIALADALAPGSELFLRMPSILLGTLAVYWLYQLCRDFGLVAQRAGWATAAFALSHWGWHTSSYLHPDVFLATCWLLALRTGLRACTTHETRHLAYAGAACGLAVLCKYSGAFLGIGLALCVLYTSPSDRRISALGIFSATALLVASPLVYAQLETGFYLPQTLSTLSRIEALTNPFTRLIFFAVNPLLFISPVLLYLLYRALLYALGQLRHAPSNAALIALLPALCTIGAFLFFALFRGQIKGNWILIGFLGLWPLAFALPARSALYAALILSGLPQTVLIGLGLKHPAAMRSWIEQSTLDRSYTSLVSSPDRTREPSYSWGERLCEYSGWNAFSRDVDDLLAERGIDAQTPLASTQYSIPFGMAYYGRHTRAYYTIDDPRFRDLTDIQRAPDQNAALLFAARRATPIPPFVRARSHSPIGTIERGAPGCVAVPYDVYLLEEKSRSD